jgi:hypothetical protein
VAIVMNMTWDGVSLEQYDQVLAVVKWETAVPAGGIFHAAWSQDGALRVVDVWESAEAFQAFADSRLMPGVAQVGIQGAPAIDIQPVHRYFDASHG